MRPLLAFKLCYSLIDFLKHLITPRETSFLFLTVRIDRSFRGTMVAGCSFFHYDGNIIRKLLAQNL